MPETKVIGARLGANLIKTLLYNLNIERTGTSSVRIFAGLIAGTIEGDDILEVPSDLNIDGTVSGIGGLDTGSLVVSTWYSIWLVKDPSTEVVGGVLSVNFSTPSIPSTYKKRRIGAVYNKSSGGFRNFKQHGDKIIVRDTDKRLVLSSALPIRTWYSVDLTTWIPTSFQSVTIEGSMEADDRVMYLHYNNTDTLPTSNLTQGMQNVTGTIMVEVINDGTLKVSNTNVLADFPLPSRTLYYYFNRFGSSASNPYSALVLLAYRDNL